jgi:hypothetical protein
MTAKRHTGLSLLRRMARIVTVIVTMCYLLPGLLSVLPSPASAAEQQLYADLMLSRCLDGSNQDGGLPGGQQHNCNDCCIVCASSHCATALRQPVFVPVVYTPPLRVHHPEPELVLAVPPSEAVFGPLSQRGPPA